MALGLFANGAAPAEAQTANVLISNTGVTDTDGPFSADTTKRAQGFFTGPNTRGYTLSSIGLVITTHPDTSTPTVELWSASGTNPSAKVADLTSPTLTAASTGLQTFTAPANTTLTASTRYFLVVYCASGACLTPARLTADGEDDGAASGWNIDNAYLTQISSTVWSATAAGGRSMRISVNGEAVPPPAIPGLVVDTNNAGDALVVSWTEVTNANRYDVHWKSGGESYTSARYKFTNRNGRTVTISGLTTGTAYTVRVQAQPASGPALAESEVTRTPRVIAEIPGITWERLSATSIKVEWPSVTGATTYAAFSKVRAAADSTYSLLGGLMLPTVSTPASVTATSLTANTDYTIQVQALHAGSVVARSYIDVTTKALPAITGLAVNGTTAADTRLDISWNAVSRATGYEIAWKETSAASYPTANAKTATTTSTSITGLTAGTEYTVRVRATSPNTNGPWADGVGTPSTIAARMEVQGRTIVVRTVKPPGTSVCETWLISSAGDADNIGTICGPSQTFATLRPGTSYTFRLLAHLGGGRTAEAKATAQTTLDKVASLTATGADKALELSWTALTKKSNDPDISYIVQWKTSGQEYSTDRQATPTTNSYTIPNLSSDTQYTVRVRGTMADRPAALGAWSDDATGTTLAAPLVPGIVWSPISATSIRVEWPAVTDASSYSARWKVRGAADSTYQNAAGGVTDPTMSDPATVTFSGLSANAEFTLRVDALGSDNNNQPVLVARSEIDVTTRIRVSTNAAGNALTLDWEPPPSVSGIAYYGIRWKSGMEATAGWAGSWGDTSRSSFVAVTASRTFTLPKSGVSQQVALTKGTRYTIELVAFNGSGTSLHTVEFTAVPFPPVPNVEVSVASATSLKVDWGAYTGATPDNYVVEWRTSAQNWSQTREQQLAATARTHTISGLTTGTTYVVRVSAITTEQSEGSTVVADILARSQADPIVLTDKPGYTLSKETMALAEGDSDTVTIRLKKKPTHDVRINPSSSHGLRFTAEPTSGDGWLRFTPSNWSTPQSVTVTALEDEIAWFSSQQLYVRWSVRTEGEDYGDLKLPKSVKLTIADNDTAGVEIDTTGLEVTEGLRASVAGGLDCYTVELTSQPEPGRIFYIYPKVYIDGERVSGGSVIVGPTVLAFTGANWKGARKVCVSAARDGIYHNPDLQAEIRNYIGQVKNSTYHNITELDSVDVEVEERDPPLRVRPKQINVFVNITRPIEMRLLAQPTANVTLNLASTVPTVATLSGSSLTFTPSNWNQYQGITVTSKALGTSTVGLSSVTTTDATFTGLAGTAVRVPVCVFDMEAYLEAVEEYRQRGTWEGVEFCDGIDSHKPIDEDDRTFRMISPPVFMADAEDQTATVGAAFSYTVPEAVPLQGDAVTYAAGLADDSALPAWLGFTASTREFSGTPAAGDVGELSVKVTATDNSDDPQSSDTTFTITVEAAAVVGEGGEDDGDEPANQAPTFSEGTSASRSVDENSAAATNVGSSITATDADTDDTLTFSLTGTDAASFDIGSSTGQIATKAGVTYNYEAKSSYSLTVGVSDGNGGTDSISVTVSLNDVAEAPTVSDTTQFKTHNATVGKAFSLTLPAADTYSGDGGTYSYLLWHKGAGKNFATETINGLSFNATTRVLSGKPAAAGTWELSYVVHDGDTNRDAATDAFRERDKLKIVVAAASDSDTGQQKTEPANRAPSFDSGIVTALSVDENSAAGTNVGAAFTATDPDTGDTLTYSLTGTDAASFTIGSSTGQITTKTGVTYNYEGKSSYSLAVNVSDGKLSDSTPVTVSLNDVNEAPAFAGASTARKVDENSGGSVNVGAAVTASDPDAGATLTYTLSGTDAASFAIGGSTGQISTKTGVTYNYESKSSYSLTVTASDGKLSDSITVTVSLNNVNEAPAFGDGVDTTLSIDENSAAGTKVDSAFTATDPDTGDTLTYSLTGTDAASFTIGSSTGQIATKTGVIYNYEAKSSYSLSVVASDGKGGTDSISVTVSLNDVAEAPTVSDTTQFKNHAAKVGEVFSLTLPAADENSGDGGPYEYLLWHRGHGKNFMDHTINGLSFNAATRTISGTPTAAGVWQLSYVVHDNDSERGIADRFRAKTNLQITVSP